MIITKDEPRPSSRLGRIKNRFSHLLGYRPKSYRESDDGVISYYNFGGIEMEWFHQFIKNNIKSPTKYHFFSVFGSKMFCKHRRNRFPNSIFYSSETVHTGKPFLEYTDLCLDRMDLSMSFDRLDAPNYLRLPNWIPYMFEPVVDKDKIDQKVKAFNQAKSTQKYEAVLISNHDGHRTREPILNGVKGILDVKCAGKWKNNTRELWDDYDNDKIAYVHEFKFNICPENRNVQDYVTEKIFEAFAAGSIPIYYGSNQCPEPDVVNQDALLFWDVRHDRNNAAIKARIRELNANPALYDEFVSQEKLKPYTVDYVYDTLAELRRRLEEMG